MNLTSLVSRAHAMAPRARVTIRNPETGATTTGWAVGVPASGGSVGGADAEAFAARATIRTKGEQFVLLPDGLSFPPKPGFTIQRADDTLTILGVATLNPTGTQVLQYRVTAQR